jgi:hypothetical protein
MRRRRTTTAVRCDGCGLWFTTSDPPAVAAAGDCAFCGADRLVAIRPPTWRLPGRDRLRSDGSLRGRG